MEKSIDERDAKGYITTADLVAFFGEGSEDYKKVYVHHHTYRLYNTPTHIHTKGNTLKKYTPTHVRTLM